MPENNTSTKALLFLVATCLFTMGGPTMVNYLSGDSSIKTVLPSAIPLFLGIVVFIFAIFWNPRKDSDNPLVTKLWRWSTSPVPYALLMAFLFVYFETLQVQRNIELATLRNDQHSILDAMDRYVLPRTLTEDQINGISGFLQNFPSHQVIYNIVQGDEEAGSYCADIRKALTKAGWRTKEANYVTEEVAMQGASIGMKLSDPNEQRPSSDLRSPNAATVLGMAFGLAGVQMNGGGSAVLGNPNDYAVITVGHRRRDPNAIPSYRGYWR